MKTTIDTSHYAFDIDLGDVSNMINDFRKKFEEEEERIEELERENAELKERLQEKI